MSTQIVPFDFNGDQVRTVTVNDEPWFALADVCRALDISNPSQVASRLDEDALTTNEVIDSMGRSQSARFVNEPGLYEVIFISRKPEAKAFKRWITHEVIPAIRKTGSYALSNDEIVHRALQITHAKVQELEAKVEADAPKVEYVERFVGQTSDVITVDLFASQFGTTGPKVRELLLEKKIAVRRHMGERWSGSKQRMEDVYEWRPRQGVPSADWFEVLPQHNAPRLHNGQVRQTMYVRQFHALDLAKKLGLEVVA